MSVRIDDTVALVTGANRGIGRAITIALLERGARKVYAGARRPDGLAELRARYGDRLVPFELDVTSAAHVNAATERMPDLRLVINNAGVAGFDGLSSDGIVEQARREMEVNYIAPLRLINKLAPTLKRNGGGRSSTSPRWRG